MIPMKAPPGYLSLSVDGTQYNVRDGVIEVPPTAIRHGLRHGFQLLTRLSAEETLRRLDDHEAVVNAAASYELVTMRAPEGYLSAVVDGEQYQVVEGVVKAPSSARHQLTRLGFEFLAAEPAKLEKVLEDKLELAPAPLEEIDENKVEVDQNDPATPIDELVNLPKTENDGGPAAEDGAKLTIARAKTMNVFQLAKELKTRGIVIAKPYTMDVLLQAVTDLNNPERVV